MGMKQEWVSVSSGSWEAFCSRLLNRKNLSLLGANAVEKVLCGEWGLNDLEMKESKEGYFQSGLLLRRKQKHSS